MRTDQKLFCLKTTLTIALCILWLVGAAIFGVVLWLRLDFWTNEYLELNSELDRYLILVYIALAAGAVIAALSLLGLIGACLKSKWLIVVYLIAVVTAMILTISAFVYGAIYREELRDSLVNDNLLENIIRTKYVNDRTSRIVRAVDIMQSELQCCGARNPRDYDQSNWFLTIKDTLENKADSDKLKPVPATCCKEYLRYQDNARVCYIYKPDTDQEKSNNVWETGCEESLQQFLDKYVVVIISVAAVFFVLQVKVMIICSVLIHLLNSLYVPQPDDIVYDMAHNQEKSPYPSRGDYRDYYH